MLSHLIIRYLHKGAAGFDPNAMCTESLHWEQGFTIGSSFRFQFRDTVDARPLAENLSNKVQCYNFVVF